VPPGCIVACRSHRLTSESGRYFATVVLPLVLLVPNGNGATGANQEQNVPQRSYSQMPPVRAGELLADVPATELPQPGPTAGKVTSWNSAALAKSAQGVWINDRDFAIIAWGRTGTAALVQVGNLAEELPKLRPHVTQFPYPKDPFAARKRGEKQEVEYVPILAFVEKGILYSSIDLEIPEQPAYCKTQESPDWARCKEVKRGAYVGLAGQIGILLRHGFFGPQVLILFDQPLDPSTDIQANTNELTFEAGGSLGGPPSGMTIKVAGKTIHLR